MQSLNQKKRGLWPREAVLHHSSCSRSDQPTRLGVESATVNITLISPYELGRQPFGLAEPCAWLREAGFHVDCLDLSIQSLDPEVLGKADLVGIYVAMHTATRIAVQALPRIRDLAQSAHLCVYGLYAPMNEALFRALGVGTVLGGEFEPGLLSLTKRLASGTGTEQTEPVITLDKIDFKEPDRSTLPSLSKYAKLMLPDGSRKIMGFAEASRGCKHLCRHCPIVPVYEGKFRVVPLDVTMADIRGQVGMGAEHISFGDPDFFNGPTHAKRLVYALHDEFPKLTYDVTVKIQHLIDSKDLLPNLKDTGCLFVTSAVESVDDEILGYLDKNHTNKDFGRAVRLMREVEIALAPTFVAFNPWITLQGYIKLLARLVELKLAESVPPVQLAIRLLVPEGSYLLRLPGFRGLLKDYDSELLGYPWHHRDPRVDVLQSDIQILVERAEQESLARRDVFNEIWCMAHQALGRDVPQLPNDLGQPIPHHSEPWYCCAEPTNQQLQSF